MRGRKNFDKLIITATLANPWIYPEIKDFPKTAEEMIEEAVKCYEKGASIVHIHPPKGKHAEVVEGIREKCDVIIQIGMSSDPIEERNEVFEARPDMMSIILSHHDECFRGMQ